MRGQATRAAEFLNDAVTLATREGIRRPFLARAGGRLEDLLHRCELFNPEGTPFVDELRNALRAARKPSDNGGVEGLSEREVEVMRFLPTMLTAGQIAAELGISVDTVRAHLRSIYRKSGTPRRSDAVLWAREQGLL